MTPQQLKELRDKRNELSRQANALVSDKGSQTWTKEEKEKFPEFPKAKYIEIILSKGAILHIPKDWWFATQALEDSIEMTIDSNSIFSYFIK
jgi:hypothetical protein